VHIIAENICAFSNYELVFWTGRMFKRVIRLKQGAAWHASIELAIGIAGRRRKDTVRRRPEGLIVSDSEQGSV
jgi:hypothetical protein